MSGAIPFAGNASARSTWHREPIDRYRSDLARPGTGARDGRAAPSRRFSRYRSVVGAWPDGPSRGLGAGRPRVHPLRRPVRSGLLCVLPLRDGPAPPESGTLATAASLFLATGISVTGRGGVRRRGRGSHRWTG